MPLTVEKLYDGTVIDHIPAGNGLTVLGILHIDEDYHGRVALVMNVPSKAMGKKDIVKIQGKHIEGKTADKIAVIAPKATLNLIKKGKVVEKRKVTLPEKMVGVFNCPNSKCVTNLEKMQTRFSTVGGNKYRCTYCERVFTGEELEE